MSSKLERDIDEVLAKIERFPPKRSLWSRIRRRLDNILGGAGEALASIPRPRISIGQVLLLGIAVIVIGFVGFRGSIGNILIIGGILTFIGAFIFSLRRQSASRRPQKMWRGQPMDLDRSGGSEPWWKRWRSRR